MALIKSAHAATLIRDAIALDLGDLERKAARIVADAEQRASDIVQRAKAEAELLTSSASEQGRAEGRAAGREQGLEEGRSAGRTAALDETRAQLDALCAEWKDALASFQEARERAFFEAHEDVLRFALTLAARVIHRAIEVEPSLVEDQVRAALRFVREPTKLNIALHPEDQSLIADAIPSVMNEVGSAHDVELVQDQSITRGGCRVSVAGGDIDATIEQQVARIAETLLPGGGWEPDR